MTQESKDVLSRSLWKMSKATWGDTVSQPVDTYNSLRYTLVPCTNLLTGLVSEGVGSKISFASELNEWSTIGSDILAMVLDDVARVGGATVRAVTTTIDIGKHSKDNTYKTRVIKDLMHGLTKVATNCAGVPIIDGELSELVFDDGTEFPVIVNASAMWTMPEHLLVDGTKVRSGDSIIALPEPGFRSNGFTLLRKIINDAFSCGWKNCTIPTMTSGMIPVRDLVMTPSSIYYPAIRMMMLQDSLAPFVNGLVHITGGGVPGKLGRYLHLSGNSAYIDKGMPCVNPLIGYLLERGHVSVRDAVENWNMGYGFLIITPHPDPIIAFLEEHYFRTFPPRVVGKIIEDSQPRVSMAISSHLNFYS